MNSKIRSANVSFDLKRFAAFRLTLGADSENAQSIVDTQAEIVPGYGIVTVQLTDGRTVSGTLMSESDNGITVNLPDNSRESFAASEIISQSKSVGTMPDPKTILNLRQIRDLLAYLATMN